MRKRENPLAIAAVFLIVIAGCAAHRGQANRAPNALEPVSDDAKTFPLQRVVTPPNGYPGGSMSTDDTNRERQGYPGYAKTDRTAKVAPKAAEDRVVVPSAAPVVKESPKKPVRKWTRTAKVKKAHRHHVAVRKRGSTKTVVAVSPAVSRLREVEALNRLHHLNLAQIALADIALARSPSSTTLAMAQQAKDEHRRAEEKVKTLAARLDIKLESFSPATYEVAAKNELTRDNDAHFNELLLTSLERARNDAAHDLLVAHEESMRDRAVVALIDEEKPLLAANRVVPARYRNEAIAHEGDFELGK